MGRAYVGMGSNRGDRWGILRAALGQLAEHGRVAAASSPYETEPWGAAEQPAFLNAACLLETDETPAQLLASLKAIERVFGRDRSREERWGPRTLDLDLLLYDDLIETTEELTLPHPLLHRRAFALVPLAEIAPDVLHPTLGKTVGQLVEEVGSSGVRRVGERLRRG